LIACNANETPNKSDTKDHKAVAPSIESKDEVIDYKSLFAIAEQEELALYYDQEQRLQAIQPDENLDAKSFIKTLLSDLEEGVRRKIFAGDQHGLTSIHGGQIFIVVDSNIPDDSLESDIRFMDIRKTEKSWSLASVASVWRCYSNRGHQDYSTIPCD